MGMFANKLERLPENFTFGIELEFTGAFTFQETELIINRLIEEGLIRKGWTVHYDNSVVDANGKGAEIVSPVLKDDAETERELRFLTNLISTSGGVMGEKVGGHVHYGAQCLGDNIEQIQNFFKLYAIFEPLLYKLSTGDLGYVREGCSRYAMPIQNRLNNVIDGDIKSFADLFTRLAVNLGANATHYGEYRYYGLNIQRMIEAIRNMPPEENIEEFIKKMLSGEPIFDKDGNKLSPTIEMRFRNGSSSADEILRGIRLGGQMFVRAKDPKFNTISAIKSLYRKAKKIKPIAWIVTQANRLNPEYMGLTDQEIIDRKFANSRYGDGKIDPNTLDLFLDILYPDMPKKDKYSLMALYMSNIKQTPIKSRIKAHLLELREQLQIFRDGLVNDNQPILRAA